jgi:hypothetical protein
MESEGGSTKRKEVGNDNSLASIFAKQQAVTALNKQEKNTMAIHSFKKEKKWGWTKQHRPSMYAGQKRTHMTLKGRRRCMQQCQNAVWTQSVFQSISFQVLLVRRVCTTSWLLDNFKTSSPPPHRLQSVPKKAIKKGRCRARVSRRQPSKASGRLIGLGWCFGQIYCTQVLNWVGGGGEECGKGEECCWPVCSQV